MEYVVTVVRVKPEPIAAVRRRMAARDIPAGCKEAMDKVWAFLGRHPELRAGGHDVFLYQHDMDAAGAMTIDFGVQAAQPFAPEGEVFCAVTPEGEAATLIHRGPYNGLPAAHAATHAWLAKSGRKDGGWSWEIYGEWSEDPAKLETQVLYLLQRN